MYEAHYEMLNKLCNNIAFLNGKSIYVYLILYKKGNLGGQLT